METVVLTLMILVGFGFCLKLTFHRIAGITITALLVSAFVYISSDDASEMSKSQISEWLSRPELMLDTSVLLTIEIAMNIGFCFLTASLVSGHLLSKTNNIIRIILLWFPGILIFPVLLALLTWLIFSMPGTDFMTSASILAVSVLIVFPIIAFFIKYIIPENELRLEFLFLVNIIAGALGIIATVNGRTAVAGTSEVDLSALCGVIVLLIAGLATGYIIYRIKLKRKYK